MQARNATDSVATLSSPLLNGETSASRQLTQNDIVVLAGERGTWQVVAPANGSKADIRRREGFDTRVVTAFLENLTIVRCANSPGVQLLSCGVDRLTAGDPISGASRMRWRRRCRIATPVS